MKPGDFSKYAAKSVMVPAGLLDKVRKVLPAEMFSRAEKRLLRPGSMPRKQVENLLSRVGLSGTDIGYMPMKMAPSKTTGAAREAFETVSRGRRASEVGVARATADPAKMLASRRQATDAGNKLVEDFSYVNRMPQGPTQRGVGAAIASNRGNEAITVREWLLRNSDALNPRALHPGGWTDNAIRRGQAGMSLADIGFSGRPRLTDKRLQLEKSLIQGPNRIVPGSTTGAGIMDKLMAIPQGGVGKGVRDVHPSVREQYKEILRSHVGSHTLSPLRGNRGPEVLRLLENTGTNAGRY